MSSAAETAVTMDGAEDLTADKDGGVLKRLLTAGYVDVRPADGNTVFVHYVGKLPDGTVFDSSVENKAEFKFTVGRSQVIKGFDLGIKSMQLGEAASFTIQPNYGYGEKGSPPKIPPDTALTFEIELLRIEGEDISPDRDRSILKSTQKTGEGYETASDGSNAKINVKALFDKTVLYEREFDVVVGECTEAGLPEGMDKALMRIRKGETAYLVMQPRWAYGPNGCPELNIPPNAVLHFVVTTLSFDSPKQLWSMDEEELLMECEKIKNRGTDFLKAGKYKLAIVKYLKITEHMSNGVQPKEEEKQRRDALLKSVNLNLALAYIKMENTLPAIKACADVLSIEPNNVKALYRRAQALQMQKDYEEALADYDAVLAIEPENKAAMFNRDQCRKLLQEERARQRSLYSAMFTKISSAH